MAFSTFFHILKGCEKQNPKNIDMLMWLESLMYSLLGLLQKRLIDPCLRSFSIYGKTGVIIKSISCRI